jgi:hypothetical protein
MTNTRRDVERQAHHHHHHPEKHFNWDYLLAKRPITNIKMRHSSILIASQLLQVPVYGFPNQRRVVGEDSKDIIINI